MSHMSKQITKTIYWIRNVERDYESFDEADFGELIPESYITIGKCQAVFEMTKTDEEILALRVAGLESQKDKVRAVAQATLSDLDNKIQSLLSITHQAEA
jgi:hypothetical protein